MLVGAALLVLPVSVASVWSESAPPAEAQNSDYKLLVLGSVGDTEDGDPAESLISSGWHGAGRPVHGELRPAGSVDLIAKGPPRRSYGANTYARFVHVSAPGGTKLQFRITSWRYHWNCKGLQIQVLDAGATIAHIEYVHVSPRWFSHSERSWELAPGEAKTVLLGQLAWVEHEGCGWTGAHLHLWAFGEQVVGNSAIHDRSADPAEREDYPCVRSTWLFKIASKAPHETSQRPDCLTLREESARQVPATEKT